MTKNIPPTWYMDLTRPTIDIHRDITARVRLDDKKRGKLTLAPYWELEEDNRTGKVFSTLRTRVIANLVHRKKKK